jgi:hypothetical protein
VFGFGLYAAATLTNFLKSAIVLALNSAA